MTKKELAEWLQTQVKQPVDDSLVERYLQTHPDVKVDEPGGKGFEVLPTAIRLVPSVAGSMVGALGGPIGESIGGAVGTGLGEGAAQLYEYLSGGQKFRPSEIAAATAIGAIPFGGEASILKTMGKGAAMGGASSAIQSVVGKGEVPDLGDMAKSAALGGVIGAGSKAIGGMLPKNLHPADTIKVGPVEEAVNPAQVIEDVKKGVRQVNPTPGFDYPGVRPRTPEELRSFKSVKNFPEEQREDFLQLLDKSNDQRRGVQPIDRMTAAASQREVSLDKLKPGSTMGPEDIIAHRNAWTSIMDDVKSIEPKVASGNASDAEMLQYKKLMDQAKVIGLNWTGATSEAARVLRVQQEVAQKVALMDSEKLSTMLKSDKYKDDLASLAKDRLAVQGDPVKELELFLKTRKPGAASYANAFLYNSILSGPKTPLRKTIGDTMSLLTNYAIHPFAVGADIARHQLTGAPREMYIGELAPQVFGTIKALPEATKEMLFVMGHGYSLKNVDMFVEDGVKAVDRIPTELPGGYLTNFPLRNLKGVTAFFHELAYNQELYGSAYAKARQAGLKTPGQIQDFMVKLLEGKGETSQTLFEQATKYAKKTTFMDPSGKIVQGFLDLKSNANGFWQTALTFIAPVVRLPSKVLQRGFETSPIGFMMKGVQAGGREGAQAMGRATLGTLAMVPFMALAATGKISGAGPVDPKERDALFESGWRPNSIKVGDQWVEFHLVQPFATELAVAASAFDRFNESSKSDKDAEDAWTHAANTIGSTVGGAARSTLDQSYFASLSAFFKAVEDPGRFMSTFTKGIAQDVVPYSGAMRSITQAMDPVVRSPKTMTDSMKSIIPGESETVEPKLDRFGNMAMRPGGPIQRGLSPVGVSPANDDPVQDMLDRLKVKLGSPQGRLTDKGKAMQLSERDKFALEAAVGQAHRAALERFVKPGVTPNAHAVEMALRNASALIDSRAKQMVKQHQPLSPGKLMKKANLDDLYEAYLRSHEQ